MSKFIQIHFFYPFLIFYLPLFHSSNQMVSVPNVPLISNSLIAQYYKYIFIYSYITFKYNG